MVKEDEIQEIILDQLNILKDGQNGEDLRFLELLSLSEILKAILLAALPKLFDESIKFIWMTAWNDSFMKCQEEAKKQGLSLDQVTFNNMLSKIFILFNRKYPPTLKDGMID